MKSSPKMTKAHFELIARVVRNYGDSFDRNVLAKKFAQELKDTNPAFHVETFIEACTRNE